MRLAFGCPLSGDVARRWAGAALAAVTAMLVLSACGGSSKSTTSASTQHTSTSKTTTSTTGHTTAAPTPVSETVRGHNSTTFAPSLTVAPGDPVTFLTGAPSGHAHHVKVTITFPLGAASHLTVTASAGGHTSSATITGTGGKKVTLAKLGYVCALPPTPTFCPLRKATATATTSTVEVSARPGEKIAVAAIVGPLPATAPAKKASNLVVPTYKLQQLAVATPATPSAGKAPLPTPTVTVHPGDHVRFVTRLIGATIGAPQNVTVSFDQGPAQTIKVSASIAGGPPQVATLKSAGSGPISLVDPTYTCAIPPNPTFCPAVKIVARSRSYKLTFAATPLSPILIGVTAQAG